MASPPATISTSRVWMDSALVAWRKASATRGRSVGLMRGSRSNAGMSGWDSSSSSRARSSAWTRWIRGPSCTVPTMTLVLSLARMTPRRSIAACLRIWRFGSSSSCMVRRPSSLGPSLNSHNRSHGPAVSMFLSSIRQSASRPDSLHPSNHWAIAMPLSWPSSPQNVRPSGTPA
jgi:hypothetical protein